MKFAMTLLVALVAILPLTVTAGEPDIEIEKQFKVVVAGGGDHEVIQLDGDDLAVGESRQFFTDSGKEVLVTRTEDGLDVEIDGEDLDLDTVHKKHIVIKTDGDGDDDVHRLLVEALGDEGAQHAKRFVFVGDDSRHIEVDGERFHWSTAGEDGEPHAVFMKLERRSAAEHLEQSGALDGLDEATRARVLEALRDFDSASPHIHPIGGDVDIQVIHSDDEEHEHHHDER